MISKERSSRGSQRHGGREPAARWSVSWQVILRSPPKGPRVKQQEDIPSPTFWFYAALFRTAVSGGRLPRRSPSRTPLVRRLFCDLCPNLPAAKINASGCLGHSLMSPNFSTRSSTSSVTASRSSISCDEISRCPSYSAWFRRLWHRSSSRHWLLSSPRVCSRH